MRFEKPSGGKRKLNVKNIFSPDKRKRFGTVWYRNKVWAMCGIQNSKWVLYFYPQKMNEACCYN